MKKETLNLDIKGEVTILLNDEEVYKNYNEISLEAIRIVTQCLAAVPINHTVNRIIFAGSDFTTTVKTIIDSSYDFDENSITFKAIALESDFSGTVTDLFLNSSQLGNLALRTGLSFEKDENTRMEVRWKITINQC